MKTQSVMTVAPTEEPVTVDEVKLHLRIDETADDELLEMLIQSARQRLEKHCDRKFITQTWITYLDQIPSTSNRDMWWDGVKEMALSELFTVCRFIELPFAPLQSVTSIKTYADDDTFQTMPVGDYQVDLYSDQPRVALRMGAVWPTTILRPMNGVAIETVLGYGNAATVPAPIKTAIMDYVAALYEHRGDENTAIPPMTLMALEPYRRIKFG